MKKKPHLNSEESQHDDCNDRMPASDRSDDQNVHLNKDDPKPKDSPPPRGRGPDEIPLWLYGG